MTDLDQTPDPGDPNFRIIKAAAETAEALTFLVQVLVALACIHILFNWGWLS